MFFKRLVTTVAIFSASYAHSVEIVTSMALDGAEINKHFIRAVFSGKARYWPDGTPIRVVTLPKDTPQHLDLCKDVLKVHPRQFSRNWDIILFSGFGEKPILVDSDKEALDKIKNIKGSIGYVSNSNDEGGIYVLQVK